MRMPIRPFASCCRRLAVLHGAAHGADCARPPNDAASDPPGKRLGIRRSRVRLAQFKETDHAGEFPTCLRFARVDADHEHARLRTTFRDPDGTLHLKLNELLAATRQASNRMIGIEDLDEQDLRDVAEFYVRLAARARDAGKGKETHSIDEEGMPTDKPGTVEGTRSRT